MGLNLPTELNGLFAINMLITAIFALDVVVQFFRPLPKKGSEYRGEKSYERRHTVLCRRYVLGWMPVNALHVGSDYCLEAASMS